jgi:hypothetical protein
VTMSSVTLPPGRYTLSGIVRFSEIDGDGLQTVLSCSFLSFAPVHQQGGYGVTNPTITMPVIGDVALTFTSTIFLRCTSISRKAGGAGSMIATRVESITPSS